MGEVTLICSLPVVKSEYGWTLQINLLTIKGHYKCNYNKYVKIY